MDGRLEYQSVGGSPTARVPVLRSMRRGLHLRADTVHRRPFESLDLRLPDGWQMATDGTAHRGSTWTVTVAPHAFTLWV